MVPRQDASYSSALSSGQYSTLTVDEVEHFIKHGWVKLSNCFSQKQADDVCANVWNRLQMDPNDKSTWHTEWQALPGHRNFKVKTFAPRAWGAICDLLNEYRIPAWNDTWDDALIVNLGTPEGAGKDKGPRDIYSWHVDGDFFVHFLDSPEQALLVVPLWTDVVESGGGTWFCPDSIPMMAAHLHDHAKGVMPDMVPRGDKSDTYQDFYNKVARMMPEESFLEMTGKVGDVYFLHPLMLHSTSNNKLRAVRIISNPCIQLKEPFNFARVDPSQYNVVELSTREALKNENLKKWRIKGKREFITPERLNKDNQDEQSKKAQPPLDTRSESRDRNGNYDSDGNSNSTDSNAMNTRQYRKETPGQAGMSFLKGIFNPSKKSRQR